MLKNEDRGFSVLTHAVLALFSLACIIPIILLIISSFTSESTIITNGYSLFPEKFSLDAYRYLFERSSTILHAFSITIVVTIVGTTFMLLMTALTAYPLSNKKLVFRKGLNFYVVLTLLFNGGMIPTYLVYTQMLHLRNTVFALIIPGLLMNGFNVMIMKSYFTTSIPGEVLESAKVDGAGEFRIFARIVMPMSLPILATVGLFGGLAYWNDWYNGLLYLTKPTLFSLQNVLNRIILNIQYLSTTPINNGQIGLAVMPTQTVRMAIAVVAIVPVLIIYPFIQKYFVKGISLGAVKG